MLNGVRNLWSGFIGKYFVAKHIGSTHTIINWQSIIDSIKPKTGDFNTPLTVIERANTDPNAETSYYDGIMETWKKANYDFKNIQWYDYYPGEHFDIDVQTKFANIVNADPRRVFISELWPGHCVPYHWDVEDFEDEWLKEGELVRYVCFLRHGFGHAFVLEDECFYNIAEGEIYKWDDYKSFHAGTNAGEFPYYLFHFLGIQR